MSDDLNGWVLVPVKATKAMIDAAFAASDAYEAAPEPKAWCGLWSVYEAMIAAAPSPPVSGNPPVEET